MRFAKIVSGKEHGELGTKLYVGNLDTLITSDDLTQLFTGAGRVVNAQVITDRDTGRSKGFAFIEMANEAEALQAIELYNRHSLGTSALIVNEARPSENVRPSAEPSAPRPKFREVKHKRRGGADRHRFH
jgi:RNA recognition motif-containing protein